MKRLALAGATATLALGFATTAMASGPMSGHRHQMKPHHNAPAVADQVVQWNQVLQQVLVAPGAQPASIHPTRTMAITQIAVYDAVNGILRRDRPLLVDLRGPRDASADAAAASAAHTALDALLPSQAPAIDAAFATSMSQLRDSWAVRRGFAFGARVARAVLAARAGDDATMTPPVFNPSRERATTS